MKNPLALTLQRTLRPVVCLLLALLFISAPTVKAGEAQLILVLSAQESDPFVQVRKAFEKNLSQHLPDARFLYHQVERGVDIDDSEIYSKTLEQHPSAVLALGADSATYAQKHFPDSPQVATMLLNDSFLQQSTNHKAILLHFPAEIQLRWLSRFLPQAKRIGILYDPAQNSDWVKEAEAAAQGLGLEIIGFEASSAKKLQTGLKFIGKKADALLAIPDQTVYSGKTAKQVLLFTFRNRIPFVGLSTPWVKAGALYALEADYRDLGRQAAEVIRKNLAGASSPEAITYPQKISYKINKKSIDHLHLEIDPALINGASKVFN